MAAVNQNGIPLVYHWLACDLCGNVRSTTDELAREFVSRLPLFEFHKRVLVCKECKAK
jgi:hypothetical protein